MTAKLHQEIHLKYFKIFVETDLFGCKNSAKRFFKYSVIALYQLGRGFHSPVPPLRSSLLRSPLLQNRIKFNSTEAGTLQPLVRQLMTETLSDSPGLLHHYSVTSYLFHLERKCFP